MPVLASVKPDHPCDRCNHPSKYHAPANRGSHCMVVGAKFWHGEVVPKGMKARQCPCGDYVLKP